MSVLSEPQRELLRTMLNRLVPAHDDLPGAGDLDVGGSIERTLESSPRLRRMLLDGLAQVAILAERETGCPFVEASPAAQSGVLHSIERAAPVFFAALVEHTYRGYYTLPRVRRAYGIDRAPQPIGYQLPTFDPSVLDRQRQRAPFWRKTS